MWASCPFPSFPSLQYPRNLATSSRPSKANVSIFFPARSALTFRSSFLQDGGSIPLSSGRATQLAQPRARWKCRAPCSKSRKEPLRLLNYKACFPSFLCESLVLIHSPLCFQTSLRSSKIKLLRISKLQQ